MSDSDKSEYIGAADEAAHTNQTIEFYLPNRQELVKMHANEYIRWLCLIEAVNIAADKAKSFGVDWKKSDDWIKPNAFKKYIADRQGSMKQELIYGDIVDTVDTENSFSGKALHV